GSECQGVQIEVVTAGAEKEYEHAFSLARARAGAVLVRNDPVLFSQHRRLVALVAGWSGRICWCFRSSAPPQPGALHTVSGTGVRYRRDRVPFSMVPAGA